MKKINFNLLDLNILISVLGVIVTVIKGKYDCVFPWSFALIGYVCAKIMMIQTQSEQAKNDKLKEKLQKIKQDNEMTQDCLEYYKSKYFSFKNINNFKEDSSR